MNLITDNNNDPCMSCAEIFGMLKKNIETVPPHGCQRDAVLAVLEMKGSHGKT